MDQIITQLQDSMKKEGYDYLLAAGTVNVFYLSDMEMTASACNPVLYAVQPLSPTVILVPAVGARVIFTSGALKQYLDDRGISGEKLYYPTSLFVRYDEEIMAPQIYGETLECCVRRYFSDFSCTGKSIVCDTAFLNMARIGWKWREPFESAESLLIRCRSRKVTEEIQRLRLASRTSYDAMEAVQTALEEGGSLTELELFYRLRDVIYRNRCQWNFTSLSAGPYSPDIYHCPSQYKLRDGDVVRMDVGAVWSGYGSDVARTCFYGSPRKEDERLYQTLREAQKKMIESIRPGRDLGELFSLGDTFIKSHGYPEYHRAGLGHSVGIITEEEPFICPGNHGILMEENMVFSVETPYYIKDKAGFNVEDIILVTERGYEILR